MLQRFKNRLIARLAGVFPRVAQRLTAAYTPATSPDVPWAPLRKPLRACRVALVTTAGVHHRGQRPFDMLDVYGDPSLRVLDSATIVNDYVITHDYFDHRDADRDLNVVFPLDLLRAAAAGGFIGEVAPRHVSFMGHIQGRHLSTLVSQTAPAAAAVLAADGVDAVVLTPG